MVLKALKATHTQLNSYAILSLVLKKLQVDNDPPVLATDITLI